MTLRLTNTLTGKKEEFAPFHPPRVSLYVCGVTVYDDCHIGHARGAIVFDVLRRYLAAKGFEVTHVRNITDLDDKIIDRARQEGLVVRRPIAAATRQEGTDPGGDLKAKVSQLARRYEASFRTDFDRLGLLPPHHEPRATEFIPQMIAFISALVHRGMAYVGTDGVYFSVRKISPYGELSHQKLDQMRQGVRGQPSEGKEDPLDFALWKKAKPDEPTWESPWGAGRPGWHIECSAMSAALLGDSFDIHGGGQDLIFPHHENERAQALGAEKSFARLWIHHGLLTVNGQKMSKSLGNIVGISEVLSRHSADVLRLFFLSAHYRSPIDFTWGHLQEAASSYERLLDFVIQVEQRADQGRQAPSPEAQAAEEAFGAAMDDDLNTPLALSALHRLVGQAHPWLDERGPASLERLRHAASVVKRLGEILGLSFSQEIPRQVEQLLAEREALRKKKEFKAADDIRHRLLEEGFILEDTGGRTVVRRKV